MPKLALSDRLLRPPPLHHLRMEALHTPPKNPVFSHHIYSFSAQLRPRTAAFPPSNFFRRFFGSGVGLQESGGRVRLAGVKMRELEVSESWLSSLSTPLGVECGAVGDVGGEEGKGGHRGGWVLGIDPDMSGALAVLSGDGSDISAQVFDTPTLKVEVGKTKRTRKRLDPRAIVQILQSLEAPLGTTAYIEQSSPFPKDGRQGWWGGGFGYGMWIGILVASGYSVVPIHSTRWKNHFKLSGSSSSKDDSRNTASSLFPSMSAFLRRKKDHGRAESLLIAAYGKGLHWQPVIEESNMGEKENILAAELALTQII